SGLAALIPELGSGGVYSSSQKTFFSIEHSAQKILKKCKASAIGEPPEAQRSRSIGKSRVSGCGQCNVNAFFAWNRLFRPIDLRLLQLVRVVYVHRLPFGIEVDCTEPALAMTVARGLHPTKRQVNLSANGRRVNVGDPGIKVAHSGEGSVHILCVDGG